MKRNIKASLFQNLTLTAERHHSTCILDGTDEAYSSEQPPFDAYSNSGAQWKKPDRTDGSTRKNQNQRLARFGRIERPDMQSNRFRPLEPAGFIMNRTINRLRSDRVSERMVHTTAHLFGPSCLLDFLSKNQNNSCASGRSTPGRLVERQLP